MKWLSQHMAYFRLAALGLLLLGILGPWYATSDGVPPPEWCTAQHHLLEDGRCVRYAPATEIFGMLFSLFLGILTFLLNQATGRDLLVNLVYFEVIGLLLFPFFGFLIGQVAAPAEKQRWHGLGAFSWGLGAFAALAFTLVEARLGNPLLWGRLVYLLVCLGMGLVEVTLYFAGSRLTPANRPAPA